MSLDAAPYIAQYLRGVFQWVPWPALHRAVDLRTGLQRQLVHRPSCDKGVLAVSCKSWGSENVGPGVG